MQEDLSGNWTYCDIPIIVNIFEINVIQFPIEMHTVMAQLKKKRFVIMEMVVKVSAGNPEKLCNTEK